MCAFNAESGNRCGRNSRPADEWATKCNGIVRKLFGTFTEVLTSTITGVAMNRGSFPHLRKTFSW